MDPLEPNHFDSFPVNFGNAAQNEIVVGGGSYFNGQAVQVVPSQRSPQQIALAQAAQQQQQLGLQSAAYPGNPYFIAASPTQDPYGGVSLATVPSPQAQQVVAPQYQATYNMPWGVYQPSNTGQFVQQQQAQLLRAAGSSGRPAGSDVIPQQVGVLANIVNRVRWFGNSMQDNTTHYLRYSRIMQKFCPSSSHVCRFLAKSTNKNV